MARFVGKIGFGETAEIAPGVYDDIITERKVFGDIMWDNRRYVHGGDTVNMNLTLNKAFSVVADSYTNKYFHNIRYVLWNDTRWTVTAVEHDSPRLRMYIGEVYNGPTPPTSE